jgi:uncharacterized Zn finger protein
MSKSEVRAMKRYEVHCPCCGHRNIDLYLDETEGWMECEKCGELTQVSKRFAKAVKIPVFRMEDPGKAVAAGLF